MALNGGPSSASKCTGPVPFPLLSSNRLWCSTLSDRLHRQKSTEAVRRFPFRPIYKSHFFGQQFRKYSTADKIRCLPKLLVCMEINKPYKDKFLIKLIQSLLVGFNLLDHPVTLALISHSPCFRDTFRPFYHRRIFIQWCCLFPLKCSHPLHILSEISTFFNRRLISLIPFSDQLDCSVILANTWRWFFDKHFRRKK